MKTKLWVSVALLVLLIAAAWQVEAHRSKSASVDTVPLATAERAISGGDAAAATQPQAPSVQTGTTESDPTPLWGHQVTNEGKPIGGPNSTGVGRVGRYVSGVSLRTLKSGQAVLLDLPGAGEVHGTVATRIDDHGAVRVGGSLLGGGIFSFGETAAGVHGQIRRPDQNLAYLVSTLPSGQIEVREIALSTLICTPYAREERPPSAGNPPQPIGQQASPDRQSRPGATAVLFLDFDGATVTGTDWLPGQTIVAAPSPLSDAEITQVWQLVKEDYAPFDINITTVESVYTAAPVGKRMRVIITPTDTASPGAGGVAFVASFARAGTSFDSDVPCWVFNYTVRAIADTISHEAGHTFGLLHDGCTSPVQEYYSGHGYYGYGPSWAPIMGVSYYATMAQWSKGEYPGANNLEDDIAIIAGAQAIPVYGVTNNTGFIPDDNDDTRATASVLDVSSGSFSRTGVVRSQTDVDYFAMTLTAPRRLVLQLSPANTYPLRADLDPLLEIEDAAGNVLFTAKPDPDIAISTATTLPAGTFYLRVQGDGHAAWPAYQDFGYSSYGSIGAYTVAGQLEPVVAPSITANPPSSQSLYASQYLSLTGSAAGTAPLVYQWKRDGTLLVDDSRISGALTASLSISNLVVGDAGSYTLEVSNAAGTAVTTPAAITVTVPPPPTISYSSGDVTVVAGNSLNLYTSVYSVVSNVTYQWYRDDAEVVGQTSSYLWISPVQLSDAGSYKVKATNAGGSTTSPAMVVTVNPATLPVIDSHPQGDTLYDGQYFSLYVSATSNAPVSYQWYHDGVAIAGATGSSYGFYANAGSAGEYYVTLTNGAGTVTSYVALVTVSSTLPPKITGQPYSYSYATIGSSASFSVSAVGTGPLYFQWYHDGQAIPNASYGYFSINSVSLADLGEYYVVVSNPNGSVVSETVTLSLNPDIVPDGYWSDALEKNGVVYFLFKHNATIARYDLAAEAWLSPWNLVAAPTAFTITDNNVYVAFGTTIKKYSATFTNGAVFATSATSTIWLQDIGTKVLAAQESGYSATKLVSYLAATGQQLSEHEIYYYMGRGFSYDPSTKSVFARSVGISPGDISSIVVNDDGSFASQKDSPYHGAYPTGYRTFFVDGGTLVTDEGGIVYEPATLVRAGSFGRTLKDAVDIPGGFAVVNGTRIYRYDAMFRQLATKRLTINGARLWRRNESVFVFAQPTSTTSLPVVQKIDPASIEVASPAPAVDGYGRQISADQVLIDEQGVVYILDRTLGNVLRWSTSLQQYLPPLRLASTPRWLAYSADNRALYFDNGAAQIRKFDLGVSDPSEEPFYSAPQTVHGLQAAGLNVLVADPSAPWSTHYVVDANGNETTSADWNYRSSEYTWSPTLQRMYFFRDDTSPNDLHWEKIGVDGKFIERGESPYHGEVICKRPIRVSPDGTEVILGSGQVFDGTTLTLLGAIPSAMLDATWTTDTLHTLYTSPTGGTRVRSWNPSSLAAIRSADFPGTPVRLFSLSEGRLLLITRVNGYLQFRELTAATLATNTTVDTREHPQYHAGDFNQDKLPDLVWQNRNTGERGFWLMNGTSVGSYVSLATIGAEWEINGYADFNGDMRTDLILSNIATGERKLWLMDGVGKTSEVALGTVGTEWEICGVADFNGDGKPDIVWQNTISGQRGMWLMNGAAVGTFIEFATVGTEWQICATGDFNGDGKPDIVWQNTISGERGMWLMNGTQVGTYIAFATVGTEWSIVGAADFNGDGKTDIVWQNAISGERGMWLMNGTQVGTYIAFATVGTEWSLGRMPYRRAVADFNADNQPDIIWSNTTTGERGFWIMNGLSVGTYMKFADVATSWRIAGSADFNADSKADIIWENTVTGERGFWIMNGTSVGTYMKFADVGTEWRIAGSADFNADSKADIIWENTVTGERGFWIMNGTSVGTYMKFADVGTEWRIAGAADFNGDAKPDIIWENTTTGERGFWVMNGTSVGYYQSFATLSTDWQLKGAADFNHDGKPDIIRQNTVTGERGVWFMNGMTAGTYQPFATVGSEWTIGN